MNKHFTSAYAAVFLMLIFSSFSSTSDEDALKDTFKNDFLIGAALSARDVAQPQSKAVLSKHFNSISLENLLKWEAVHPRPDTYNFDQSDQFVALGEELDAFLVGHTLVWHNQTPKWVFENGNGESKTKEELLKEMENHIETVMGRYRGKINGWDVVNEAFTDDGNFRQSAWYKIAGIDFIKRAFIKAAAVDPGAELYYNDYNLWKPAKIDGVIRLVKELQKDGIKIDGIGMQGHYGLTSPGLSQVTESIEKIKKAGLKVMITELDIDVLPNPSNRQGADIDDNFAYQAVFDPYRDGLPDSVALRLANRYEDLFSLFTEHRDVITRVTMWGIRDQDSWLNNWPIRGRIAYPLLFGNDYKLKKEISARFSEMEKGK